MPWSPNPVVKINTTTVTGSTIDSVSITMGRQDITEQCGAGYASINLVDYPINSVNINDTITIQINNYSSVATTVYTGYVTDISTSVLYSGSTKVTYVTNIQALGVLSKLAIKSVNLSGYAEQLEGNRMVSVVTEAFGLKWNQLPTADTWDNYNTTSTWDQVLGVSTANISTPGLYTLYASTASDENGLDYAATVATSGMGQLYETTSGNIGYADQNDRAAYVTANGFVNISKANILANGISVDTTRNNLINDAVVYYGTAGLYAESLDTNSIDSYGKIVQQTNTFLKNLVDAQTYADRQILLNAAPSSIISGMSIQIDAPTMSSTLLNALVGTFFGMPIAVTDFDSLLYPTQWFGFVEGWTWTIDRFGAKLDLNVSDFIFSSQIIAWQDVYAGEIWSTIDPALKWEDALLGVN